MSQIDKVIAYYQATGGDYQRFWMSPNSLAMHFGYYDDSVRTHDASLLKNFPHPSWEIASAHSSYHLHPAALRPLIARLPSAKYRAREQLLCWPVSDHLPAQAVVAIYGAGG